MEKKEDRWCKLAGGSGAEEVTLVVHIHRRLYASGRRTSKVIGSIWRGVEDFNQLHQLSECLSFQFQTR